MATLEIDKKEFEELMDKEFDEETLLNEASFLGAHWHGIDGKVCEVETYPNRPDLLSVEGLARAYKGFFEVDSGLEYYQINEGDIEIQVESSVEDVRPYIGGAVIRGVDIDRKIINGWVQLQEKLHETMGRKRDKLAIGLHDLSEVKPPFTYKAVEPEKVSFTPLEYDKNMQLGEILDKHEKGMKYSWILEDEDKYPIIEDTDGKILSFPPIINNQLTEVETDTTDIFIDVTGKHKETVLKALNILVTALADRGGKIESVEIDGEKLPRLENEEMELDPEYFRDITGIEISRNEIAEKLKQMKYGIAGTGDKIVVEVPSYRTDVMHQYDLIEDVVIAHGYRNVEPELPEVDQIAEQKDIEDFKDVIRQIMVGTGAMETNTYYLTNKRDLFDKMEKDREGIVEMSNPLTKDYTVVRNWLLPSLLEVLVENKHQSYPQEFFETAEVAELDGSSTGSSNRNKMTYLSSGQDIDFTDAREVLQVLERDLGVELEVESEDLSYCVPERGGKIIFDGEKVGEIAEISQKVRENWDLDKKISGFEIDVEKLYKLK